MRNDFSLDGQVMDFNEVEELGAREVMLRRKNRSIKLQIVDGNVLRDQQTVIGTMAEAWGRYAPDPSQTSCLSFLASYILDQEEK